MKSKREGIVPKAVIMIKVQNKTLFFDIFAVDTISHSSALVGPCRLDSDRIDIPAIYVKLSQSESPRSETSHHISETSKTSHRASKDEQCWLLSATRTRTLNLHTKIPTATVLTGTLFYLFPKIFAYHQRWNYNNLKNSSLLIPYLSKLILHLSVFVTFISHACNEVPNRIVHCVNVQSSIKNLAEGNV